MVYSFEDSSTSERVRSLHCTLPVMLAHLMLARARDIWTRLGVGLACLWGKMSIGNYKWGRATAPWPNR